MPAKGKTSAQQIILLNNIISQLHQLNTISKQVNYTAKIKQLTDDRNDIILNNQEDCSDAYLTYRMYLVSTEHDNQCVICGESINPVLSKQLLINFHNKEALQKLEYHFGYGIHLIDDTSFAIISLCQHGHGFLEKIIGLIETDCLAATDIFKFRKEYQAAEDMANQFS